MNPIPKFCSECGAPLEEGTLFCAECGAAVTDLPDSNESKFEQEKIVQSQREAKRNNFDPSPPKSTEKIKQDNEKTYGKDSTSGNNRWLIVFIILSLILVGGVYVYMEQQNQKRSYSHSLYKKKQPSYIKITKQMLFNRILYAETTSGYGQIIFLQLSLKSYDGHMVFIYLDKNGNFRGSSQVPYRLKDGRIFIYSEDGSRTRVTLVKPTLDSWVLLSATNIDGDDKQFDNAQPVKEFYHFRKPKEYPEFPDIEIEFPPINNN